MRPALPAVTPRGTALIAVLLAHRTMPAATLTRAMYRESRLSLVSFDGLL